MAAFQPAAPCRVSSGSVRARIRLAASQGSPVSVGLPNRSSLLYRHVVLRSLVSTGRATLRSGSLVAALVDLGFEGEAARRVQGVLRAASVAELRALALSPKAVDAKLEALLRNGVIHWGERCSFTRWLREIAERPEEAPNSGKAKASAVGTPAKRDAVDAMAMVYDRAMPYLAFVHIVSFAFGRRGGAPLRFGP